MIPILQADALTPFWLAVTIGFETGILGFFMCFVYLKVIPFVRKRAKLIDIPGGYEIKNPILRIIIGKRAKKLPVASYYYLPFLQKFPIIIRWWIYFIILQGVTFTIVFVVLGLILTTKGWQNPFTWDGLYHDLIFARINETPNGAHIFSYLGIPILCFIVMAKYKDAFLGLLTGAFMVAVHEGIWVGFYYLAYWQFLDWGLLTYVLKDVSFAGMIALFIFTFIKYPYQQMKLRIFYLPSLIYFIFNLFWYIFPIFTPELAYQVLPITTINNFKYGLTVYNETAWFADPYVNFLEVFSWLFIFAMFAFVIIRAKKIVVRPFTEKEIIELK